MAPVPCGDETGVYYIIVSGLPFKSSWQKLKDFVRYPTTGGCIKVDHVCIYPNSTDGWISIRGKEDFRRAYEYLNGPTGVFEGKALAVDDRNGHGPVMLRDLAPMQTSATQEQYSASSHDSTYLNSSSAYDQGENFDSLVTYQTGENSPQEHWRDQVGSQIRNYSPGSYSSGHSQTLSYESSSVSFSTQPVYAASAPQSLYMASPHQNSLYQQPVPMAYLVPVTQYIACPYPMVAPPYHYPIAAEDTSRTVKTEARKIIITHLPHSTTEKELQGLLERASTKSRSRSSNHPDQHPIESFEIPRHSDGKSKGHAFAVFTSHSLAKRVVDALHGSRYQGRELKVRLTKEGAEPSGQSTPIQEHMYTMPTSAVAQNYELPPSAPDITTHIGQMSLNKRSDSKRERKERGKSRGQEKSYDTDGEREKNSRSKSSNSTSAPCVVDGSGRRRHR